MELPFLKCPIPMPQLPQEQQEQQPTKILQGATNRAKKAPARSKVPCPICQKEYSSKYFLKQHMAKCASINKSNQIDEAAANNNHHGQSLIAPPGNQGQGGENHGNGVHSPPQMMVQSEPGAPELEVGERDQPEQQHAREAAAWHRIRWKRSCYQYGSGAVDGGRNARTATAAADGTIGTTAGGGPSRAVAATPTATTESGTAGTAAVAGTNGSAIFEQQQSAEIMAQSEQQQSEWKHKNQNPVKMEKSESGSKELSVVRNDQSDQQHPLANLEQQQPEGMPELRQQQPTAQLAQQQEVAHPEQQPPPPPQQLRVAQQGLQQSPAQMGVPTDQQQMQRQIAQSAKASFADALGKVISENHNNRPAGGQSAAPHQRTAAAGAAKKRKAATPTANSNHHLQQLQQQHHHHQFGGGMMSVNGGNVPGHGQQPNLFGQQQLMENNNSGGGGAPFGHHQQQQQWSRLLFPQNWWQMFGGHQQHLQQQQLHCSSKSINGNSTNMHHKIEQRQQPQQFYSSNNIQGITSNSSSAQQQQSGTSNSSSSSVASATTIPQQQLPYVGQIRGIAPNQSPSPISNNWTLPSSIDRRSCSTSSCSNNYGGSLSQSAHSFTNAHTAAAPDLLKKQKEEVDDDDIQEIVSEPEQKARWLQHISSRHIYSSRRILEEQLRQAELAREKEEAAKEKAEAAKEKAEARAQMAEMQVKMVQMEAKMEKYMREK